MNESVRIGKIAGIPVGFNWSLLLIAGLLTFSLAGDLLPLAEPGLSTASYVVVAAIASVGFFASILAHEFGHSIVAQRRGIPVEGITLWLLGGVARLRREPADARTELAVSAAGPLTSLAVAVLFGVVAFGLDTASLELLAAAAGWLAAINVLLAVFNLIPAAPLDGGRILSGVLWLWHGDRDRAKLTATTAGLGFGWLLMGLSAWILLVGGGVFLWPVLLGMFVLQTAGAERRFLNVRRSLAGVRVGDVMTPVPFPVEFEPGSSRTDGRQIPVPVDAAIGEVLADIAEGETPVIDAYGRLVGFIGPRRLAVLERHQLARSR